MLTDCRRKEELLGVGIFSRYRFAMQLLYDLYNFSRYCLEKKTYFFTTRLILDELYTLRIKMQFVFSALYRGKKVLEPVWSVIFSLYLNNCATIDEKGGSVLLIVIDTKKKLNKMGHLHSACKSKARLTGKTVVITGADSGAGKETALDLYWRGKKVKKCEIQFFFSIFLRKIERNLNLFCSLSTNVKHFFKHFRLICDLLKIYLAIYCSFLFYIFLLVFNVTLRTIYLAYYF